ncbi:hypothetical protein [Amycolatopsis nigrescens]|uniref:hypothetical protein n=1 Tax=Amycolatopsis nigrescens TaxID=381445 RepID=UPI0006852DF2|nr:hypothetical protein [Amycolatopsis nigrescens]
MERLRLVAGWVAGCAAGVYTGIKIVWVAGGTLGLSDPSAAGTAEWIVANVVTGAIGLMGVLVALALTQRWGLRVPAWLIAMPMWVGTGLLTPFIMLGPLLVFSLTSDESLQGWVFGVVYGSFAVLGISLLVAVALYTRARWPELFRGTTRDVARGATHSVQVPLAWVAGIVAAGPAVVRGSWLFGGTFGLSGAARQEWRGRWTRWACCSPSAPRWGCWP